MERNVPADPSAEEAAALQGEITRCLREIDELRREMRADQAVIVGSCARTRGMLADLRMQVLGA